MSATRSATLHVLAVALGMLTSGCLGGTPGVNSERDLSTQGGEWGDDGADASVASQEGGVSWSLREVAWTTFTIAEGVPFLDATWGESPAVGTFNASANATRLVVTVEAPVLNASRPGGGLVTFVLKSESNDYREGEQVGPFSVDIEPRERTTFDVANPPDGAWAFTIWPKGVVANQGVRVEVVIEGIGNATRAIDLSIGGPLG